MAAASTLVETGLGAVSMLAFAASIAALAASIDAVATKHARSTALALAASTEAAALRHACLFEVIVEGVVYGKGGGVIMEWGG